MLLYVLLGIIAFCQLFRALVAGVDLFLDRGAEEEESPIYTGEIRAQKRNRRRAKSPLDNAKAWLEGGR